jgi:hypothetical protein
LNTMTSLAVTIVVLCTIQLLAVENLIAASETIINPVMLPGDGPGSCATAESRQDAIASIETAVKMNIIADVVLVSECGGGLWYSVAKLDMTDPRQQCPPGLREYTNSSVRVCGRPTSSLGGCTGTSYSTAGRQFSKVCGRAIGYQVSSPDGFFTNSINEHYVDGVSVTYGSPRNHIWTFGVGVTENSALHRLNNCPCSDSGAKQPPSFVGNNYFCESGNPSSNFQSGFLYSSDKLWDGEQCSGEGTCCTGPPWFSVDLPNTSTDDIEVRICGNEGTGNEDTPIELMEIYIQ